MDFQQSTHLQRWIFSKEELDTMRRELNAKCRRVGIADGDEGEDDDVQPSASKRAKETPMADSQQGAGAPSPSTSGAQPLSVEEELRLLRFFQAHIQKICQDYKLPTKVMSTALLYYKRFYLSHSCVDHEPKHIMLTCIYVAAKVEEAYISAEDLCRTKLKQDPATVLRTEVTLLQGLKFDLIVYSPYRALAGFWQDVEAKRRSEAAGQLDAGLASAEESTLEACRGAAHGALAALLLSDAPLLFPPAQIALAALRSGCNKHAIPIPRYIALAAAQADAAAQPGGARQQQQAAAHQQLHAALDVLDALGLEGSKGVGKEEAEAIDRRLKAWRSPMSEASKQAQAAQKEAANAKRESKLKARRQAAATAEAQLLGTAPPPAAGPDAS